MVGKRITEPGFSDCPAQGRSFRVAMAVIGGIALFQLVALVIGLVRVGPPPVPAAVSAAPPVGTAIAALPAPLAPALAAAPAPAPVATPSAAPLLADTPVDDPVSPAPQVAEAAGGAEAATAGSDAAPGSGFFGPAPAGGGEAGAAAPGDLFAALDGAGRSQPLSDGILERLLVTGAELRASGNMQGALQAFREVEKSLPEHPRILSEIGATLGKMGLKDKADGYWEQVDALGAIGGGPFHPIAAHALRGEALPGSSVPPSGGAGAPAAEPAKTLKIREIQVEEQAPTGEGQKVGLRVVIGADPSAKPAGEDLSLLVYFYDRLPDGMVRPSTADTSYLYPTEPYDWQVDGTEVIVVNYLQPVFTEEQKRELGERSFYGYAIELYYRDELQDKVAMPEDIASLRFPGDSGADGPGGPGAPSLPGPENALFPDSVVP